MVALIEVLTNPAVIAGLCTILGGILLKVAEKWLHRHGEIRSDRQDYRAEIKELNERIDKLEEEITYWRDRYYHEQQEAAMLRVILIQNGLVPPATP